MSSFFQLSLVASPIPGDLSAGWKSTRETNDKAPRRKGLKQWRSISYSQHWLQSWRVRMPRMEGNCRRLRPEYFILMKPPSGGWSSWWVHPVGCCPWGNGRLQPHIPPGAGINGLVGHVPQPSAWTELLSLGAISSWAAVCTTPLIWNQLWEERKQARCVSCDCTQTPN